MREIDGVVLTAKIDSDFTAGPRNLLIGPAVNEDLKMRGWENLSVNGLTTFENVNQASGLTLPIADALSSITKVHKVGMANIYLNVAENYSEWDQLNPKLPYVLIVESDFTTDLYGIPVEGAPRVGYIPVTFLEDNGLRGWNQFESARRAHEEFGRQGGRSGKIANFKLRRVPIGSVGGRRRPLV